MRVSGSHIRLATALLAAVRCTAFDGLLCVEVRDPTRLPIPRAVVSATELGTWKRHTVMTGDSGRACFASIPEGLYAVEAGTEGFVNVRYYPVRLRFPFTQRHRFELPLGELREGGIPTESVISGTLRLEGEPVAWAKICIKAAGADQICTTSNSIGQYALFVPPAKYRADITRGGRPRIETVLTLDVSVAGTYIDKLLITR